MVRIHPIQTSLERTGLFPTPPPRVVVPWHCLAGLRRALLSPCSALRRTSSHHGHGRQWPSSPPPLLPTNLAPAGRLPPPSMARRLSGASQTSPRRQFLPRPPRHVVWHGRRRVPACGAIYTRSTRTVRDSTPWRTEEQHGARATGQREAALLAADVGGGGSHSDALSVHPRAVSFLASRAGSRLAGGWLCRRTRRPGGWTVFHLPSTPRHLRAVQPTSDGRDILNELQRMSNPDMVGLSDTFLEPVTEVNLQCQVSLSPYNKQKTLPFEDILSLQDCSYLKAGIYFAPHLSLEHTLPANRSSEIVAIVGEDQHCLNVDVTLEQLEDIILPRALDYFYQNTEASIYKMIWKSKHSSALIQVEKASMSTQKSFGGARKRKMLQGHDKEFISRKFRISHLFDLWRAHVPVQLRSAFKDWLKKEKFIASQLDLKF